MDAGFAVEIVGIREDPGFEFGTGGDVNKIAPGDVIRREYEAEPPIRLHGESRFRFPTAVLDGGMHLAREQVESGEQTQRAVTLAFVIAREGRLRPWLRRQVRRGVAECLDTRLLVIGDLRRRARLRAVVEHRRHAKTHRALPAPRHGLVAHAGCHRGDRTQQVGFTESLY